LDLNEITALVRVEVAKHTAVVQFRNTDDLLNDLGIDDDDLTAIALDLERQLHVKLDGIQYRQIANVITWAEALHARISQSESRI
jgi:hypothetical protein